MNHHNDTADLVEQGIAALKSGDKPTAAKLLYQATRAEPNNQTAWLWLSGCVKSEHDQRKCLERVLEIDPDSKIAKRATAQLQAIRSAEATAATHVPLPPAEPAPQPAAAATVPVGESLDRQVMEWAITNWTQKGWVIVSQTETAAQLKMPRRLGCSGMFVVTGIFFGMVAALVFFSGSSDIINFPSAFVALGLLVGAVMVMLAFIGEYYTWKEEVVYLTTKRLYKAYVADAAIRIPSSVQARCSFCGNTIGSSNATQCRSCKRQLIA